MENYVALLRGINVGGKNKVSMPALKESFEQNGFQNVITYINSGNILLSSEQNDVTALKEKCEALIAHRFQLEVPVFVISVEDLLKACDHAPPWWGEDEHSTHNAIFILPPITVDEVVRAVGAIKPEYEQVDNHGRVVYWSAPVKTYSRTRWSKLVGTPLYDYITIRNANTFRKLSQLALQSKQCE